MRQRWAYTMSIKTVYWTYFKASSDDDEEEEEDISPETENDRDFINYSDEFEYDYQIYRLLE